MEWSECTGEGTRAAEEAVGRRAKLQKEAWVSWEKRSAVRAKGLIIISGVILSLFEKAVSHTKGVVDMVTADSA
ncbi:hypothetical protein M404DRAFT_17480 [Pisolithus tinctorius Marx 270]|uniref:Uncharacterized protein n=1 Tax=Pisolithus tinctorius Marx 270 TaxID=870435 RepID=A0A0C3PK65_PISTI|nr:hypothetical protein M404DRAFT_17480 [Pisolithus tinctorius Marx 270]